VAHNQKGKTANVNQNKKSKQKSELWPTVKRGKLPMSIKTKKIETKIETKIKTKI
jgi:Zn-dependent M16 (insulinase) family peptidase